MSIFRSLFLTSDFACSPRVCVSSLHVLWLLPTVLRFESLKLKVVNMRQRTISLLQSGRTQNCQNV